LLFDGVHYDAIALTRDGNPAHDETVFGAADSDALSKVQTLVEALHQSHQFTDLRGMSIKCGVCGEGFKGTAEAIQHQKSTGHTNFQEISK
jgi:ubiquitin thioesterase OTU1